MMRGALIVIGSVIALAGCDRAPAPSETDVTPTAEQAVAEAVQAHQARFASAGPVESAPAGTAYRYSFEGLSTPSVPMTAFGGEVVMVVNTASKCGFTPQYEGLQTLYEEYGARGFNVLGVPSGDFRDQELETAEEIREFCTLNFGVTFPMAGRSHVTGENAHPFYVWAREAMGEAAVPAWNFHKLLIDRQGRLVAAFPSSAEPTSEEIRAAIERALQA